MTSSSPQNQSGLWPRLRSWLRESLQTNEVLDSSPDADASKSISIEKQTLDDGHSIPPSTSSPFGSRERDALWETRNKMLTVSAQLTALAMQSSKLGGQLIHLNEELHAELRAGQSAGLASTNETTKALNVLASSLEGIPATQQSQEESLRAITQRLDATERCSREIAAVAETIPAMAERGAGSLREIREQLHLVQQRETHTQGHVESLSRAMEKLVSDQSAQAEALERINTQAVAREQMLTDLADTQNKRFGFLTKLVVAALVVALAVVAIQIAGVVQP